MKRRILTISLIVASLVLLVSVGFAGWVITQNTTQQTNDANFTAYSVEKDNLTVSTNMDSIVFGKPSGGSLPATVVTPWLTVDSMEAEDLTATFTISWSNDVDTTLEEGADSPVTFTLAPEYVAKSDSSIVSAPATTLIGAPTFSLSGAHTGAYIDGSTLTLGKSNSSTNEKYTKDTTLTIVVTYSWGSCLANSTYSNPYTYFNSVEKTATTLTGYSTFTTALEIAEHALADLETFTSANSFRIKVTRN